MQRRRFYAAPDAIGDSVINLSGDESHHLARVLRLRTGDEAFAFDGCGREYRCRVASVDAHGAQLEIIEALADTAESPVALTLALALAKGEKFDLIVQKATELGVRCIAPLITENADVRLSDERAEKRARQVDTVSDGSKWQMGEEVADQGEERIAGRMLDAQEIARQNEQPVVFQGHRARSGERVKREQQRGADASLDPVGPDGPEALRCQHQRFAALEPPQVNDAVVKKFQNAATSAPASPAAQ